jgi:hypothetical protein
MLCNNIVMNLWGEWDETRSYSLQAGVSIGGSKKSNSWRSRCRARWRPGAAAVPHHRQPEPEIEIKKAPPSAIVNGGAIPEVSTIAWS